MDQTATHPGEMELLIAACGRRDHDAFRRLYELQSARLHGVALRMTRDPGLAADVLHEALLQVWHHADRFDAARGSAEAWLIGLVRYRAIDVLRRYAREQTGATARDELVDAEPDPLQRLLATDDGARLHACLETLDERQRRVVVMSFWEGLSHAELAARLAAPLGTVKSWVRRGLLGLRACLGR